MNKWISVKDRLPPEDPMNLTFIATIFSHYKQKQLVWPLTYIDGQWYTMDAEFLDGEYEVTHWMPLPEKPNDS